MSFAYVSRNCFVYANMCFAKTREHYLNSISFSTSDNKFSNESKSIVDGSRLVQASQSQ